MKKIIKNMQNKPSHTFKLLAMLAIMASLSACNQDMSDLQNYVNNIKKQPAQPIEPIPVIKPYVRFIYPGHGADPFDMSVLAPEKNKQMVDSVMIDENRVPEFLEGFPLDSLRMVGTVFKENELWALVRIPEGAVHRVRKGNYIGQNHGKITEVNNIKIALTEIIDNGFGGHKERDNELSISSPSNKK